MLINPWTLFRYLVIGLYVGMATIGVFIIWYTHGSFLDIDFSGDGHTLVTFSQLANWGQCSSWENFTVSPFTAGNHLSLNDLVLRVVQYCCVLTKVYFITQLSLLLRGTVVAPLDKLGEALQDERINGGAFIGTDGLQFPHKLIPTRNATGLVAPAIALGLSALTHTLGTLVPVIGASAFATAAAVATTIGTIVDSFR